MTKLKNAQNYSQINAKSFQWGEKVDVLKDMYTSYQSGTIQLISDMLNRQLPLMNTGKVLPELKQHTSK